jgi:hypothetical protein
MVRPGDGRRGFIRRPRGACARKGPRMAPTSIYDRLTPEQLARIRLRYEESDMTVAAIGREEGFTTDQIHQLRKRFHWPSRKERKRDVMRRTTRNEQAIAQAMLAVAADASAEQPPGETPRTIDSADAMDIVRAAQTMLAEQLSKLRNDPDGAQKTLTALASFMRSMSTVKAFEADAMKQAGAMGQTDDEPPLDLAELRRELVRRLDQLRADRDAS